MSGQHAYWICTVRVRSSVDFGTSTDSTPSVYLHGGRQDVSADAHEQLQQPACNQTMMPDYTAHLWCTEPSLTQPTSQSTCCSTCEGASSKQGPRQAAATHLAEILDRSACSGSRNDRRTKVWDRSVRWYFQAASSFLSCSKRRQEAP